MFAAVKMIVAAGIACGTLIVSFVEAAHPQYVACFWLAFAFGAIVAEVVRARRRRSIRWVARKVGARGQMRQAPSALLPGSFTTIPSHDR
jgi:alpha/beta superfamily hydrolase